MSLHVFRYVIQYHFDFLCYYFLGHLLKINKIRSTLIGRKDSNTYLSSSTLIGGKNWISSIPIHPWRHDDLSFSVGFKLFFQLTRLNIVDDDTCTNLTSWTINHFGLGLHFFFAKKGVNFNHNFCFGPCKVEAGLRRLAKPGSHSMAFIMNLHFYHVFEIWILMWLFVHSLFLS
jgi:hypothetical protein